MMDVLYSCQNLDTSRASESDVPSDAVIISDRRLATTPDASSSSLKAEASDDRDRDESPVSVLSHPPPSTIRGEEITAESISSSDSPVRRPSASYEDILAKASKSAFGGVSLSSSSRNISSDKIKASFRARSESNYVTPDKKTELWASPSSDASFQSVSESSAVSPRKEESSRLTRQTKVVMGDRDAEVEITLAYTPRPSPLKSSSQQQPHLVPPSTPVRSQTLQTSQGILQTSSLLDTEGTPSPAPRANLFPRRSPPSRKVKATSSLFSFGFCCTGTGVGCVSPEDEGESTVQEQDPQKNVERTIEAFLSDPVGVNGGWCNGWQAWSSFAIVSAPNKSSSSTGLKDDVKAVLRKRACNMNSRRLRVRRIKNDIDPFQMTPSREINVSKTSSFSTSRKPRRRIGSTSTEVSSMWETMTCTEPTNESPFVLRSRGLGHDDEQLCYDSDPEDTTRRRSRSRLRSNSLDNKLSPTLERDRGTGVPYSPSKHSIHRSRALTNEFGDDAIKAEVQDFLNETFTLVWHPSAQDSSTRDKPQAMKAWLERGQQLDKSLVHPKLVWRPMHPSKTSKQRGLVINAPNTVDLLDITRILATNRVDRGKYPFAKPSRSLLIECLDQTMMFEASSESERDRIVHCLKLLVARLGAKIIMEDPSVFSEFFSTSPPLPGTSPVQKLLP